MKITILGAGSFGTSIGQILADNGHDVLFWSVEEDVNKEINTLNSNSKYNFNEPISKNIAATSDIEQALNFSKYVFNVIPTSYIRSTFNEINKFISEPKYFVNFSKGIEPDTLLFIHEVFEDCLDDKWILGIGEVTGPSHAELLSKRALTALTIASMNNRLALDISRVLHNSYVKTSIINDVRGLEFVSSAKNVMAIGSGILMGLGHSENILAAYVAQSFYEIINLGKHYDTKLETLVSYGGLGDLIVTALSNNSRNVNFGKYIGLGKSLDEAIILTKQVAEGVKSLDSLYQISISDGVDAPIVKTIYKILYKGESPKSIENIFK